MLTHSERFQLAHDLCERMEQRYPGQVIIGGVYGSTARGIDTPWSDLEMWFVVEDTCEAQGQHLIFRDIAVGYRVYRRSELEAILSTASLKWPFHVGVLDALKVLHGDPSQIQIWIEMGESIPDKDFHRLLEEELPGLMVESYGRVLSCNARGNHHDVHLAIAEMLFEMRTALCLLNKRWVTHDYYQGLTETFEFPKIPASYKHLVSNLYVLRKFEEIIPLAERLMENFWELMDREDIKFKNYQTVDEIPIKDGTER